MYPMDAVYDTMDDVPEDVLANKRYAGTREIEKNTCSVQPLSRALTQVVALAPRTPRAANPPRDAGARPWERRYALSLVMVRARALVHADLERPTATASIAFARAPAFIPIQRDDDDDDDAL